MSQVRSDSFDASFFVFADLIHCPYNAIPEVAGIAFDQASAKNVEFPHHLFIFKRKTLNKEDIEQAARYWDQRVRFEALRHYSPKLLSVNQAQFRCQNRCICTGRRIRRVGARKYGDEYGCDGRCKLWRKYEVFLAFAQFMATCKK